MNITACGSTLKELIYQFGLVHCKQFFAANHIPLPAFYRYADIDQVEGKARRMLELVQDGPSIGSGVGYYYDNHIFVNVAESQIPVQNPGHMRWSFPCWKTDRTAIGILAHECGHHVDEIIGRPGRCQDWLEAMKGKRVTSYEPRPWEAFAESMRLFILNPDLLRLGIPRRYKFLANRLEPIEKRPWQEVLLNHPAYVAAGERWINL